MSRITASMSAEPNPRRFVTTRWNLLVAIKKQGSPEAASALETLCTSYWFPVYAFIRRSGRSADEARDLTQAFFARVLEKNYFQDAEQTRGRFRTFLLASVRHFLANERDAEMALKRGGGVRHVALDVEPEERRFHREPSENETPERLYERRWALAALDAAMHRLAERYQRTDRRKLFDELRPLLTGDEPASYAELSARLGATEGALRVAVHRLRKQFASSLREVIAETVDDPHAVDEELRYLMAIVSR
jgi:RNA polymerase sigma factor (sigma-70 family)